jgi:type IV fimbrial biogenesis protein FimT
MKTEPRGAGDRPAATCRAGGAGFTLLEVVVCLLILALLVGIAAPSYEEYQRNSRLTGIASDFMGAVQLARSEAFRRQKIVSMCPTQDASRRSPTCADEPNFSSWIVFEDGDGDCLPVAGTVPIRAETAIPAEEATRLSARANGTCISFAVNGALRTAQDEPTADRLLVCDVRGIGPPAVNEPSYARGVLIDPSGRVSLTRQRQTIRSWRLYCPPSGR